MSLVFKLFQLYKVLRSLGVNFADNEFLLMALIQINKLIKFLVNPYKITNKISLI